MLDDILRERYVPEMPSNLTYRIIKAAKPRAGEDGFTWAAFQRAMAELFVIPQPAFAMVVVLIIGVTTGTYYTSEQSINTKMETANYSTFITADSGLDYGDFQ
jgi:hypothetical protein